MPAVATLPPWRGAPQDGYRCHLTMEQMPDSELRRLMVRRCIANADQLLQVEQLKVHFPHPGGILRRVVGYVKAVDGL